MPSRFKTATTVPVPKHATAKDLNDFNDFRPFALTQNRSQMFQEVGPHTSKILPALNTGPLPVHLPS